METLIFKILISSGLLIVFYHLFLEKERTFKFNRIFLLSTLIFAYIIPFIPFNSPFKTIGKPNLLIGDAVLEFQPSTVNDPATEVNWIQFLLIGYLVISLFFLMKFIYSIFRLLLLKGEKRNYKNQKILIINQNYAPFSFLETIYLSRKYLVDQQIDERIFLHEKCHVIEKHSIDILFVEFLKICSWFNPALFFYKKAMMTNHEFLADQYVLQNNYDLQNYQHLILKEITVSQNYNLTQQFNFNNTKKRFIMMTSKNSKFVGLKRIILLPMLAVLFVLFAKKVDAKTDTQFLVQPDPLQTEKHDVAIPITEENATVTEKKLIQAFDEVRKEYEMKKDTIKKTQSQDAAAPVSAPSKFKGILPQFPDGINAFRTLIQSNFDTFIFKGEIGIQKTTIYTNIDENGKMTDIVAEGSNELFNREAERVVKLISAEHIWTPATEDGKAVKYRFKLPLTMQFAK
ncbi:M56 family metallopeptidase [Chryseobacterium sp. MDT2-18]|uniref:M56 family metallopeptidase n=1 Tax=Chryseobacterium sp. MDT2-18 TaxID=1259136 RepID=UPI002788E907|nr:M56 family metallopeptidase [Chryseobacterium sp. MDT2-18]MDQ0475938.1 bla regulator protein BlaR1 [Chryseobacterium sp. MDT2-18]